MSPTSHDFTRLPLRVVALGGLAGLMALTLAELGATRMYATPWIAVLAATILLPPLALLLRLASPVGTFRLPSSGWQTVAAVTALAALAGALLSPYRGSSLLAAGLPLSSLFLFLVLHDWLQADKVRNRTRLAALLAAAAAVIALVSTIQWLRSVATLDGAGLFSTVVWQTRNPHPLGHANYTAGLMLFGLPWLGWLAWHGRGWLRFAAAFAAACALLNLFTSGSRGGLVGLAALALAGGWQIGFDRRRFLFIVTGALILAALLAVANPRIRALLGPTDPAAAPPHASTVQRLAMLRAGLAMGADRPLLGWGPGTVPLAYPRYRHTLDGGAENVLQLHSTPLQLWAEDGALGLLGALMAAALAMRHRARAPVAAATLAGYGVFALTDHQLDVPVFAAAVAALAALLAPPADQPAGPRTRFTTALVVFASGGVILLLGARDPAPALNAEALRLARNPAQHARAVALLDESLALNPDQEIAHFNLGWLLLVSDPARAEKHFRAAAQLVPDKGGVYFGLGLARLNQGNAAGAARALALECINEPRFLASPWWTVPQITALREAVAREFDRLLATALPSPAAASPWVRNQIAKLRIIAPLLGRVSPGPETSYRRERTGYPVLMRNADLPPPVDLYDVREDPRFPASVPFPLPSKGWLPSPRLLKLLDDPAP